MVLRTLLRDQKFDGLPHFHRSKLRKARAIHYSREAPPIDFTHLAPVAKAGFTKDQEGHNSRHSGTLGWPEPLDS